MLHLHDRKKSEQSLTSVAYTQIVPSYYNPLQGAPVLQDYFVVEYFRKFRDSVVILFVKKFSLEINPLYIMPYGYEL